MYSTADSPFRETGKKSEIDFSFNWVPLKAGVDQAVAVVFSSDSTMTKPNGLPNDVLSCAGKSVKTSTYEAYFHDTPGFYTRKYEITHTSKGVDFPHVFMFVCPCANGDKKRCWSSNGQPGGALVKGQVSFSNAFGYLSAESFPFLPYFGVLSGMYFTLLIGYVAMCFAYRRNINYLHLAVLVLATISTLECALYFFLYLWKNLTGTSTYPPPPLQWVAAIVGVFKRTLGRALVLSVSLGFTVVRPKLSYCTVFGMAGLSVLFACLSIGKEVARDVILVNDPHSPKAFMTLTDGLIEVIDVGMIAWILIGLLFTQMGLKKKHQEAKLAMYNSLTVVILSFIVIWAVFEAYRIAVSKHLLVMEWKMLWILHSFWHTAAFAILATIAYVWRPSPTSQDLSYWVQLDTLDINADDDDDDYSSDIELQSGKQEVHA
jgi:hypothetical protein